MRNLFAQACVHIYGVCLFILENDAYLVGKDRNITRYRGVFFLSESNDDSYLRKKEHKKETGYTCVHIDEQADHGELEWTQKGRVAQREVKSTCDSAT